MVTQNTYDSSGNLTSTVRDPGSGSHINATTSYAHDPVGNVTSSTNPNNRTTVNTWDAGRRLLTTTLPSSAGGTGAGVATALTYDADNRVLQTRQSLGATILRTTSATYTATGKQATATDANGNVGRFAYDLLDRLSQTTDALGRVTQYTYDALSRPYQVFNTAIAGSIPGGALVQQTYTADGLRASLTDAGNHTTSFAYDGYDRLSTTTYPDSTTEAYTYDADSNVLTRKTRASSSTTFTYAYDTLNRLTTKTPASGPVVSYSYDLLGRLTGVSDTSSAIQAIVAPGTTTAYTSSYSYNALNQPVGVSFGDVPAATANPATITPVAFSHSYNAVNQRVGQSVSDNSWISYPAAATSTAYTSKNLNQYTVVGSASPAYDNNGNLTSDGTYSFGFDFDNRLISASGAGNTASYAFDGRGRRKSRTVNGTTTIAITDADNREVLEYNGSTGAILRWYTYGLGSNDLLSQTNLGGTTTRASFIPDMLGSVVGSQDAATGTITSFAYRAYGASTSPPAQFGYTGQRVDAESGLYYYRARHYSPVIGRFLQADPVSYNAGPHLYAYVTNDPLNWIDPTGRGSLPPNQVSADLVQSDGSIAQDRNASPAPGSNNRPELEALARDPVVSSAINQAWAASNPYGTTKMEQGFWIQQDLFGRISNVNFPTANATENHMEPGLPPDGGIWSFITGNTTVAWFHTHPLGDAEGYYLQGPSIADVRFANTYNLPGIIQSKLGMYYFGPHSRVHSDMKLAPSWKMILAWLASIGVSLAAVDSAEAEKPLTGIECTVARVAERYVAIHYPDFDSVRSPPIIRDKGNMWEVEYLLPETMIGGTPVILIDKSSLKVMRAYHTQ